MDSTYGLRFKNNFLCLSVYQIYEELFTNRLTIQKHLDFDVFMITLVVNQIYMTEATNEYVITGNSALMRCVIPSFVSDFISLQNWQDEKGNVMVPHTNNYGRQQQKTLRVICNCLIYTSLNNVNWVIKKLELVCNSKHQWGKSKFNSDTLIIVALR